MSLAIPLFTDLTKAARTVLYGDTSGEGAFTAGQVKIAGNTVTADGVIFNVSAAISQTGQVVPSFTTVYSPDKSLMLMGIVGASGTLTASATLSNLFRVPGLQATLTSTPPVLGQAGGPHSLTVDYTTPLARIRAILAPNSPNIFNALPQADLSATTASGPFVLGAKVAADGASGKVTQWSVGANYTRMSVADDKSTAGLGSLTGQQWGVIINDVAPSAAGSSPLGGPGRSATFNFHQLLAGGKDSLAAEYSLPLAPPGSKADAYSLSLGVARRLNTGGLVKARVDHNGQVSLLYQQTLTGFGKMAVTTQLDPLALNKVAPAVGFSLSVA
eukprot:GHRR01000528.1.p1 GENE.GHRR01000528.1~~GHRR01000528.1.p1  ORF type:complete len:330 (+),score=115.45 GHRR01000528.1:234-1223(+)